MTDQTIAAAAPACWRITSPTALQPFFTGSEEDANAARASGWKVEPLFAQAQPAKSRRLWLVIQMFASIITLAGIHFGSTTALGASLYLVGLVFWFWLCFGLRLWGLMPLNLASTFLSAANLWKALA